MPPKVKDTPEVKAAKLQAKALKDLQAAEAKAETLRIQLGLPAGPKPPVLKTVDKNDAETEAQKEERIKAAGQVHGFQVLQVGGGGGPGGIPDEPAPEVREGMQFYTPPIKTRDEGRDRLSLDPATRELQMENFKLKFEAASRGRMVMEMKESLSAAVTLLAMDKAHLDTLLKSSLASEGDTLQAVYEFVFDVIPSGRVLPSMAALKSKIVELRGSKLPGTKRAAARSRSRTRSRSRSRSRSPPRKHGRDRGQSRERTRDDFRGGGRAPDRNRAPYEDRHRSHHDDRGRGPYDDRGRSDDKGRWRPRAS